jgi:hypothetical protein
VVKLGHVAEHNQIAIKIYYLIVRRE